MDAVGALPTSNQEHPWAEAQSGGERFAPMAMLAGRVAPRAPSFKE